MTHETSTFYEESAEDRAYFEQQMANIAYLPDNQRALISVTKRCICCGRTFAVAGSDDIKQRTAVCRDEDCRMKLDDYNASQVRAYWRNLQRTLHGDDAVDGW